MSTAWFKKSTFTTIPSGIYFNKFSCVTGWEKRLQQRNKKYKKERMLNNYNEQKVQFKNFRSLRSKASQVRITLICVTVSRRSPKILTRLKQKDQAYRYTNSVGKQLKKMNTHSLWSDLHMLCVWSLNVKVSHICFNRLLGFKRNVNPQ